MELYIVCYFASCHIQASTELIGGLNTLSHWNTTELKNKDIWTCLKGKKKQRKWDKIISAVQNV